MPELPDLQAFSKNLNKALKNKTVTAVSLNAPKAKASEKMFRARIEGQKVSAVLRDGKQLHFHFGNGAVVALHFMLHGTLHLFNDKNDTKHTVFEMQFQGGSGITLSDWQRAATPTLDPEKPTAPDALEGKADNDFWKAALKGRAAVKNILLDQKVVRGIGNAYADEILWQARISPFSIASKIPEKKVHALSKAVHTVLVEAEKQILQSHPDIISGEIRDFLKIHNAKRTHSPTGSVIKTRVTGGRKTYYTDEQELFT